MAETNWQGTASAFLIGLGIGAAVGILFAPNSGEETRDQIVGTIKDGIDAAAAQKNRIAQTAKETFEDARDVLVDAANRGERAYRKAKRAF
jgi:gas vesicle protein